MRRGSVAHLALVLLAASCGGGGTRSTLPGALTPRAPSSKAAKRRELALAQSPCAFGGVRALVPAGLSPTAIATSDFDGDGKPDVVVANEMNDTIALLRGLGNGAFDAPAFFQTLYHPTAIAIGDFNRDG